MNLSVDRAEAVLQPLVSHSGENGRSINITARIEIKP